MPKRRSSKRNKKLRALNSKNAIDQLESILQDKNSSPQLRDKTAKHLVKISMKSRTQLSKSTRMLICKACESALLPFRDVRVRIRNGMVISTCLKCNTIHRRGGGPDSHKSQSKGHLEKRNHLASMNRDD